MRKLIFIFALMLTVSCDKQDDDTIIIETEQATNLNLVLNGSEAGKYVAYVDPTDTSDLFDSSWVHINIGALRFPVILPDVNGDLYKLVSTSVFSSRKYRLMLANERGSDIWNAWSVASDGTPTNLGQDFDSIEEALCFAEVLECAKAGAPDPLFAESYYYYEGFNLGVVKSSDTFLVAVNVAAFHAEGGHPVTVDYIQPFMTFSSDEDAIVWLKEQYLLSL